jgi:hypothetical protein
MTSTFGWLATDARQRRNMLEAIDQFKDETTVDDLGLGVIRDAISDTLFPGTSTLHTRIRYALFVPWLLQLAALNNTDTSTMRQAFEDSEFQLVDALIKGGESQGVIGRVAGRTLQRTASSVYWGLLSKWRIFEPGFTVQAFFDRQILREQQRKAPRADDPEVGLDLAPTGIDEALPEPPSGLLRSTDFTLRPEDEQFLRHAITFNVPGTLLAHLVQHRPVSWIDPASAPESFAASEITATLPPQLRDTVAMVEKFAVAIHGASLLYNYMLANKTQRIEKEQRLDEHYLQWFIQWFVEAKTLGVPNQQEQHELWRLVRNANRRLARNTITFVHDWFTAVDGAHRAEDLFTSDTILERIAARERQKKGARARLNPHNRQALDAWSGAAGTQRYTFRWDYVVQHLQDLYDARSLH